MQIEVNVDTKKIEDAITESVKRTIHREVKPLVQGEIKKVLKEEIGKFNFDVYRDEIDTVIKEHVVKAVERYVRYSYLGEKCSMGSYYQSPDLNGDDAIKQDFFIKGLITAFNFLNDGCDIDLESLHQSVFECTVRKLSEKIQNRILVNEKYRSDIASKIAEALEER